jgi:hypothetical protein
MKRHVWFILAVLAAAGGVALQWRAADVAVRSNLGGHQFQKCKQCGMTLVWADGLQLAQQWVPKWTQTEKVGGRPDCQHEWQPRGWYLPSPGVSLSSAFDSPLPVERELGLLVAASLLSFAAALYCGLLGALRRLRQRLREARAAAAAPGRSP